MSKYSILKKKAIEKKKKINVGNRFSEAAPETADKASPAELSHRIPRQPPDRLLHRAAMQEPSPIFLLRMSLREPQWP